MSTPYAAFVAGMKDPRLNRYRVELAETRITIEDGRERREDLYRVRCEDGRLISKPIPRAAADEMAKALNEPGVER